jgi:hypothetical protein
MTPEVQPRTALVLIDFSFRVHKRAEFWRRPYRGNH